MKWSKEMYRVLDKEETGQYHTPQELLDILHPEDMGLFTNNLRSSVLNGDSPTMECSVLHKDGTLHNLLASSRMEFSESGLPLKSVGTLQDITERKQAELKVKISEEKYKTILNSSPDGILLIDMKGVITEVSEIGIELFGADTRVDLIGSDFHQFVLQEGTSILDKVLEKTLIDGLAQNFEMQLRKKNQSIFAGEISCTLIQDQKGIPFSFMFVVRDISHRKKMETKQMHADRMANLGEMAAGIAHEINQPLNIISMVMDKILFETAKTEVINVEFLTGKSNKIFENIIRIRNIIDHIRAFSRSHDNFVLTAFDLNLSIENAASMISEQFKHLGIELNLQLDKRIPQIVGNTYQFEQVIINLLTNAKDAVLEMKSRQKDYSAMAIVIKSYQENEFLVVEIIDNGIGINQADIPHITLPFYTTKEEGKGTGLGLSICYQIIREMGGNIDIKSEVLKGSRIKLILQIENLRKDGYKGQN
jgi:PAS domain S-box-containing protein